MQFEKLPIHNYIPGSYERGILAKLEWKLFVVEAELENLKGFVTPGIQLLIDATERKIKSLKERILLMSEV